MSIRNVTGVPDRGGIDAGGHARGGDTKLLDDGGNAARPARGGEQKQALPDDPAAQLVDAQLVHEPLQPGPQLVVAVAEVVEGPQHRLDGGQQVLAGGELLERLGGMRVGTQAAGDEHPETGLDGSVRERTRYGHHAHVVEHGLTAVGHAAREVDLELAGQALGVRVVQEVAEGGLGPRADVEHLVGAGPGQVAAHHVADRVPAGLPGGQAHLGQVPQQVGDPLQLHEVELDVLAGGQVAPAPAVAVGDVGQPLELLGVHVAVRELDPDHLVVAALALTVDPVVEPEHPKGVLVYPTLEVLGQQPLELLDVGRDVGVDGSGLHTSSQAKVTRIINFCGF